MKRTIRLTESELSKIISCVINEACGTPSKSDRENCDFIRGGIGLNADRNKVEHVGKFADLENSIEQIYKSIEYIDYIGADEKFSKPIARKCKEILDIVQLWKNHLIQKESGLEPDDAYRMKHGKPYRYGNGYFGPEWPI